MSWETRNNRKYYYRASKVNGRVVKEYVGTGASAEHLAELDHAKRQERKDRQAAIQQHRADLAAMDVPIETFAVSLESLTRAALITSGYHRHHGSEWRKRRHG